MFIGKWNKSVILTYVGMVFSLLGMALAMDGRFNLSVQCLIMAGLCDLFDGPVARSFKRTSEEKAFGVEIDSLVDAVNFIAFPAVILMTYTAEEDFAVKPVAVAVLAVFTVCGIARLAYFNMMTKEKKDSGPISHYRGLPVTYTAMILALTYCLKFILDAGMARLVFLGAYPVIAFFQILDIPIAKPKGGAYLFFLFAAIAVLVGLGLSA